MSDPLTSTQAPTRLVLEGVPRLHFYEGGPPCPEDIILPSVLRAYLEYLGDADLGCKHCLGHNPNCKVFCSYSFFMGVTGAASFLSWKKGWHGDNVALCYMSKDPAAPEGYKDRANGLAAYTAWAEHLLQDEAFPAEDEAVLKAHHSVHNDGVGNLAELRWYGSQFLIEAVNFLPYQMAEDLLHAAALYAGEHDLMWQVWNLAGGNENPEAFRFMPDPAVRRQMADLIHQAGEKDARAAGYIEQALAMDPG